MSTKYKYLKSGTDSISKLRLVTCGQRYAFKVLKPFHLSSNLAIYFQQFDADGGHASNDNDGDIDKDGDDNDDNDGDDGDDDDGDDGDDDDDDDDDDDGDGDDDGDDDDDDDDEDDYNGLRPARHCASQAA